MCMTEAPYGVMNTPLPIFHMLPAMDFVPPKVKFRNFELKFRFKISFFYNHIYLTVYNLGRLYLPAVQRSPASGSPFNDGSLYKLCGSPSFTYPKKSGSLDYQRCCSALSTFRIILFLYC